MLVTYFSGISDPDDHVRLGGYPGAFRELLGIRVEEFFPLRVAETGRPVRRRSGRRSGARTPAPSTPRCVTTYAGGPLAGRPAVTRRAVGGGVAWYLGTLPDDASLGALLDRVVDEAGVAPAAVPPAGVEVVRRRSADGSWLFVLNHTDEHRRGRRRRATTWSPASTSARPLRLAPRTAAVVREG